jgi:mono/diheme cytochrome c family protein
MRIKVIMIAGVLAVASALYGAAQPGSKSSSSAPAVRSSDDADATRLEGEQRFRANCGRCHAAPHKFPPRMMATIVRHMRVRATITDEDMRLILNYMTQ